MQIELLLQVRVQSGPLARPEIKYQINVEKSCEEKDVQQHHPGRCSEEQPSGIGPVRDPRATILLARRAGVRPRRRRRASASSVRGHPARIAQRLIVEVPRLRGIILFCRREELGVLPVRVAIDRRHRADARVELRRVFVARRYGHCEIERGLDRPSRGGAQVPSVEAQVRGQARVGLCKLSLAGHAKVGGGMRAYDHCNEIVRAVVIGPRARGLEWLDIHVSDAGGVVWDTTPTCSPVALI